MGLFPMNVGGGGTSFHYPIIKQSFSISSPAHYLISEISAGELDNFTEMKVTQHKAGVSATAAQVSVDNGSYNNITLATWVNIPTYQTKLTIQCIAAYQSGQYSIEFR